MRFLISSPTMVYAIGTLWALVFIALRMWNWRQPFMRNMDKTGRIVMELIESMAYSVVIVIVGSIIDNALL